MRITIVNGFFLPVPPVAGGSTEKSWYHLGQEFAARGHDVLSISRTWRDFPAEERLNAVRHRRLPGRDHHRWLWRNLLADACWSARVTRALPPGEIVIANALLLPLWLRRLRPEVGRMVVVTGRMPKGQYRYYRSVDRIYTVSAAVRDRVLQDAPHLVDRIRPLGYPIAWERLSGARHAVAAPPVTIGYVGRLHREKGLELLAAAAGKLARRSLPAWQLIVCGPADVRQGGSGPAFVATIEATLSASLPAGAFQILGPEYDPAALARIYGSFDIFCYPSLAANGETFGVAVAEAMAAGAVPVVSHLTCFADFVHHEQNGLIFDHTGADAAERLADALATLIEQPALRVELAQRAQQEVRCYDTSVMADRLLQDFSTLVRSSHH